MKNLLFRQSQLKIIINFSVQLLIASLRILDLPVALIKQNWLQVITTLMIKKNLACTIKRKAIQSHLTQRLFHSLKELADGHKVKV